MQNDAIQTLVTDLLNAMGVSVDSIAVSDGPRTVVAVTSADGQALIGDNGEVLQALNTIARRLAETKIRSEEPLTPGVQMRSQHPVSAASSDAATFLIDINGYHEAKLEELRTAARVTASRVRLFKHEVEMPPMSSYERLVVHELFADDPEIETASTGEGKFRHIVLRYKVQNTTNNPEGLSL